MIERNFRTYCTEREFRNICSKHYGIGNKIVKKHDSSGAYLVLVSKNGSEIAMFDIVTHEYRLL